ncbi:MAG: TatD family hydrolase [bacterium]
MFDSHAHLNFNTFKDDASEIINNCLDKNIRIINIGSQYDTSLRAVKMAMDYDSGIYSAIGLHPIHLSQTEVEEEEMCFKSREERFDRNKYEELLSMYSTSHKIVAIGEVGLDYFHIPNEMDIESIKKVQKEAFIEQVKFAYHKNLPIILHCRGEKDNPYAAYNEMINILDEFAVEYNMGIKSTSILRRSKGMKRSRRALRGVIHCFGANLEIAEKFLKRGFFIGFTGVVTFKNASQELLEVVKKVPLDRILVETDCPYLAPVPHRGEQCIPQYVEFTLLKVAQLKGVDFKEAERITDGNVEKLFGI